MFSWKEIVQNYIAKHSTKIRQVTRPLKEHFNIPYFSYHKIDVTGKYTVLVDRCDWAEQYVETKLYLQDPYLRHPSVYQSGITLIENHGSQKYQEKILKAGKEVLQIDSGVVLIQKNTTDVEFFGFAADKATSSLANLYLNQPRLLNSFAIHFKRELAPILNKMTEEPISLKKLKGRDFLNEQPICPKVSSATKCAFYQDLGMHSAVKSAKTLSKRERQCLKLLIENQLTKEIAAVLGLSPRTVESYFENIKNKLGCWSKQELLKLARTFDDLNLL